jgi:flagellar hook-associated protein 2
MAISAPGIGSNIDVNSIVTQLMDIEKQPLTLLDTKEASYQAKLSAYGVLRGGLASLQSAVSGLASLAKAPGFTASSSDTTVATASAAGNALSGSYSLNVTTLAQRQSLVAGGQADATTAIGTGTSTTLTFQFGTISGGTLTNGVYSGATFTQDATSSSATVTIDATNNSLQGIRDAINSANIGVTASIVKDGTAAPYRLVLQANSAGAARSIKIGVSGDGSLQTLLGYDPAGTQNLTQTAAAQSAQLTINGVGITSTSNTITDALQGVSLTLIKAGSSTVIVDRDKGAVRQSINAFVKAYNDLNGSIDNLTSYDPNTKRGGLLLGDAAARQIQSQLRNLLSGTAGVGDGGLNVLAQAGISFQRDGSLTVDSGKLDQALSSSFDDVLRLFGSVGRSSDSLVGFAGFTSSTKPGTYAVNVSTLATQGRLVGAQAAGTTITTGSNDTLNLTIDGVNASVALTPGTYTANGLATLLQAAINGASAFLSAGVQAVVTQAGGVLTVTSKRYGSSSSVSVAGNAAANLFGATPVATAGVDVVGSIGGQPATGSGQRLTGAGGSDAAGLAVDITGGATGARGTVGFSRGFGAQLSDYLDQALGTGGALASRTDGINASIKDLDNQRDSLQRRLDATEQRYRAQFTALDVMISNMRSTSNFLTQQLAQLSNGSSK